MNNNFSQNYQNMFQQQQLQQQPQQQQQQQYQQQNAYQNQFQNPNQQNGLTPQNANNNYQNPFSQQTRQTQMFPFNPQQQQQQQQQQQNEAGHQYWNNAQQPQQQQQQNLGNVNAFNNVNFQPQYNNNQTGFITNALQQPQTTYMNEIPDEPTQVVQRHSINKLNNQFQPKQMDQFQPQSQQQQQFNTPTPGGFQTPTGNTGNPTFQQPTQSVQWKPKGNVTAQIQYNFQMGNQNNMQQPGTPTSVGQPPMMGMDTAVFPTPQGPADQAQTQPSYPTSGYVNPFVRNNSQQGNQNGTQLNYPYQGQYGSDTANLTPQVPHMQAVEWNSSYSPKPQVLGQINLNPQFSTQSSYEKQQQANAQGQMQQIQFNQINQPIIQKPVFGSAFPSSRNSTDQNQSPTHMQSMSPQGNYQMSPSNDVQQPFQQYNNFKGIQQGNRLPSNSSDNQFNSYSTQQQFPLQDQQSYGSTQSDTQPSQKKPASYYLNSQPDDLVSILSGGLDEEGDTVQSMNEQQKSILTSKIEPWRSLHSSKISSSGGAGQPDYTQYQISNIQDQNQCVDHSSSSYQSMYQVSNPESFVSNRSYLFGQEMLQQTNSSNQSASQKSLRFSGANSINQSQPDKIIE